MGLAESHAAPALQLPPVLDLAGAAPLQRRLLAHSEQGADIVIDGSQVERVSTACLQVLVAAARAARSHGRSFSLADASPALEAALDDLALTAHLRGEAAA
jgi:anti-anti-sigma regulatory factor